MNQLAEILVPFPPSMNTYWRTPRSGPGAGRTLISLAGRKFRAAAVAVAKWRAAPLAGRLAVTIELYAPDARARDLDNFVKAIFDAMTHAGVWLDDEQVDLLTVVRGPLSRPAGAALVLIHECPPYQPRDTGTYELLRGAA